MSDGAKPVARLRNGLKVPTGLFRRQSVTIGQALWRSFRQRPTFRRRSVSTSLAEHIGIGNRGVVVPSGDADCRMYIDRTGPELLPAVRSGLQRASGHARVAFWWRDGKTRLERLYQEGSAKVKLPRMAVGEAPEAILINTAGGLAGGDRLATEIDMAAETAATITSQACERVYRSTGDPATVTARLRLSPGARLAWLPQETILFDGGRLTRTLEADLDDEAELIAVEAVLFGRQAMGEQVRQGALHDRWRIRRHGKLIFADDLRIDGAVSEQLAKPAILGGCSALATVLHVGKDPGGTLDAIRQAIGPDGGASAWAGKLVVRLCARDGLALRRRLESVLNIIMAGRKLPRVWEI